ncbi:MAG: MBL fold metallo-hydrolase [Dysgonamonadaceae bacterium]|jgi:glyoxylase-like metal-dependent hydrolase (beta-lactamase superfamily II)|nr:MBL fold metallo-hydrolase [Dysgonamonadaceae bacterium]
MNRLILLFFVVMATSYTKAQNTGFAFPVQTGDCAVYLLSEGQQKGNSGILIGATPEMIAKTIPDGSFPNAVNVFLIRTPDKNILVDAGFGRLLFNHLDSLGLKADEISDILITHMHGDHIGGLLKDGKILFPNAQLYISQPEYDYWTKSNNQQALNVLSVYQNRLVLFLPDKLTDVKTSLLPGIFPIATYGHTPGHTSFLIRSKNDQLLIWGDLTHAMAIQMPYPQVAVTYDASPEDAIRSREAVLKYVSENKIPIAGMHIAYPGTGTVVADLQGGYIFTPATEK